VSSIYILSAPTRRHMKTSGIGMIKKENPYNRGMIKNLKEIFFSKTAPSLVNFREWVIVEDESIIGSMTKRTGGDISNSMGKKDLDLGIIGDDGKPHNMDYNGIEDSLKRGNGGKVTPDPFFHQGQEEKLATGDATFDNEGTEARSQRNSSATCTFSFGQFVISYFSFVG